MKQKTAQGTFTLRRELCPPVLLINSIISQFLQQSPEQKINSEPPYAFQKVQRTDATDLLNTHSKLSLQNILHIYKEVT